MLYLETRSHDSADVELASGVTEELIRSLGGISQLDVRSRYVSRRLAGADPLSAAQAMNISYVVTGSLDASPTRLQVHAELVRSAGGRLVWSETYERPRTQLAGLVTELSEVIASRVAGVVIPRTRAVSARRPVVDPLAYELYVRGQSLFSQYTRGAVLAGVDLLRQSVERDSTFAPAWGALGLAWILASDFNVPRREAARHTRAASQHALALDSTYGLALANLAGAQMLELDLSARTESLVVRATRLAPRDPLVMADACVIQVLRGNFEAGLAACRASVALDSASPLIRLNLAARLMDARRYAEALGMVAQVDSLDPRNRPGTTSLLPLLRRQMGECPEVAGLPGSTADTVAMTSALICRRQLDQARSLLTAYLRGADRRAGFVTWFALGEVDSAVAVIARAIDGGPTFDSEFLLDVALDPYRRDPRVVAVMRRMGLEDGRPR